MTFKNADLPAYPANHQTAHSIGMRLVEHIPRSEKGYERAYMDASAAASVGLTKREAFAMAAMQGLVAADWHASGGGFDGDEQAERIATESVRLADTLLAELAKEPAP